MNARRTKILATIGPASRSPEKVRSLLRAGMDAARLNFSHGTHEDHAASIANLRRAAGELNRPITLLLDLQGPKVRVGSLPGGEMQLETGRTVSLVPEGGCESGPDRIPIDYPHAAEEAQRGMLVLLADGLLQLQVTEIRGTELVCQVLEGGILKNRKGVNFPGLNLRLPALTEKDKQDVLFGLQHGVEWISLSFVREAADMVLLKKFIADNGGQTHVLAKIEKPQAMNHLDEIVRESDGIMVARGDLGVEVSPEKVPMIQKRIIEVCNRSGKPVITATQMLESMVHEPFPTRAEASDVANAIIDGTDAVMLSAETAVGAYPEKAVEMMARIAREVEGQIKFRSYPPSGNSATHALCRAANEIEELVSAAAIVVFTASGNTARLVAAERPNSPIVALTTSREVYHSLNLLWGVLPSLIDEQPDTFEGLVALAERIAIGRGYAQRGQELIVIGGIPAREPGGTNFLKIHHTT